MDRSQFDALSRLVSSSQSRRSALAALLGATLLGRDPSAVLAKGKGRDNVKAQAKAKAKTKPCYPGTSCTPGKGKNTSSCDFSGSTAFFQKDVRGSNLSNSNFTGAQLAGADLRGTNLSGACLVNANLLDAKLGSSVNLGGAIFCRTQMPDGSINDRDCDHPTPCCPICEDPDCPLTCAAFQHFCSFLSKTPCCTAGQVCAVSAGALGTCEQKCAQDSECTSIDPNLECRPDAALCPFIGNCCTNQACTDDSECSSGECCGLIAKGCCLTGQACDQNTGECGG